MESPLEHCDTGAEPEKACCITARDITEVVHAEIEPADADGYDEYGGTRDDQHVCFSTAAAQQDQHIGEHPVSDERPHGMTAGKAPRLIIQKRSGVGRSRPVNGELQPAVE